GQPHFELAAAHRIVAVGEERGAGGQGLAAFRGDAGRRNGARAEHAVERMDAGGRDHSRLPGAGKFSGDDLRQGAARPAEGGVAAQVLQAEDGEALHWRAAGLGATAKKKRKQECPQEWGHGSLKGRSTAAKEN